MADYNSVFCSKCKVGFAPDTAVCPICKIPLTSEDNFEDEPGETFEPIILDDDLSSLKELRTADPAWIHHLQDRLGEAGIPYRIEQPDPPRLLFSVYVRPGDLPAANDIDDKVFAAEVPDGGGIPHVGDLDFSSCPACGNSLREKDQKCSSCGLNLSPSERWKCGNCDQVIEVNVAVCPFCGFEVESSKM